MFTSSSGWNSFFNHKFKYCTCNKIVCSTMEFGSGNLGYDGGNSDNFQASQSILGSQPQASQSILVAPPVLPCRTKKYDMQVSYGNSAISGPRTTRAGKVYSYNTASDGNNNDDDRDVEVSNTTRPARPFTANRLIVFLEDNHSFTHYGRGEIHGLDMEELLDGFLRHVDRTWKYRVKIPVLDQRGRDAILQATVRVFARVEQDIRSDLLTENICRIQNFFASSMEKRGEGGLEESYKATLTNFREHVYAAWSYPNLLNEERSKKLFQSAPMRRITEDENDEAFAASQGLRNILSQDSSAFDSVEMRDTATSTPKKTKFAWVKDNGEVNLNTQQFDQLVHQLAGSPRRSQRQANAAAEAAKKKGAGGHGGEGSSSPPAGNQAPAQPGGGGQQGGGGGGQDDGSGSTISTLFSPRTASSSSPDEDDDTTTSKQSGLDPGALLGRSGIDLSKGADVTAGKFSSIVSTNASPGGAPQTPSRKRRTPSVAGASATPSKKTKASVNLGQRISGASATSWSSVQSHPAVQGVLSASNPAANESLNTSTGSSQGNAANTSATAPAVVSGHIGYPPAISKETQQDLYDRADDMVKPVIKALDMKMKHVRISLKTLKDRTKRTEATVSRIDTRLKYIEDGVRVLAKGANAVKRRNELQGELHVPFNNETDAYNAVASPESQELLAEWIGLLPIRASHSQWADKVLQKLFHQDAWFRVSYHNEDKTYELGKDHELWEFGILLLRVPPGVLDVLGTMIKSERDEATADKLLVQLRNWIRNREAGRREHMRRELQLRQVKVTSSVLA